MIVSTLSSTMMLPQAKCYRRILGETNDFCPTTCRADSKSLAKAIIHKGHPAIFRISLLNFQKNILNQGIISRLTEFLDTALIIISKIYLTGVGALRLFLSWSAYIMSSNKTKYRNNELALWPKRR